MSPPEHADVVRDVPLTATGIPVRNLWHMLVYAWNEVRTASRWEAEAENAPTLDALLAAILSKLMAQRLKIGLGRGYRDEHDTIRGIRGRIDFERSLKEVAFQQGRAHCRFQVFSPNVPVNQVVRATLARLAQVGEFGPKCDQVVGLRQRLRRQVRDLGAVDLIELKPDFINRQQLLRHDADYRLMLAICHLVLQRQIPAESAGLENIVGLDRDAMTLWRVFEKFVANFFRARLAGWRVSPQAKLYWPVADSSDYMPVMNPDVVLQHIASGTVVVLDTKFTASSLTVGQWEKRVFNRDHLFQIYAYLRTQEDLSDEHRRATGILLYPTARYALSETTRVQGHRIRFETIDLARPWQEIEANLLQLIRVEAAAEAGPS